MRTVKNQFGRYIDFDVCEMLMDDILRRHLRSIGITKEQEMFDFYCHSHKNKYKREFEPNTPFTKFLEV